LVLEYLMWSGVAMILLLIVFACAEAVGGVFESISNVGAPGLLLAAIFFPGGAHSSAPFAYLALAVVLDSLIYAWLLMWVWRILTRIRPRRPEDKV
jgi:hypothetical protein